MTGCFYCNNDSHYHPTCDAPDCTNQTHGSGPDGKRVQSYCDPCSPTSPVNGGERA